VSARKINHSRVPRRSFGVPSGTKCAAGRMWFRSTVQFVSPAAPDTRRKQRETIRYRKIKRSLRDRYVHGRGLA